jgi:hypothetical protein
LPWITGNVKRIEKNRITIEPVLFPSILTILSLSLDNYNNHFSDNYIDGVIDLITFLNSFSLVL